MQRVRFAAAPVSIAAILGGCGPVVRPDAPDPAAEAPVTHTPRRSPTANPGRQVLIGEMCPQGADGRPGVAPLFLRSVGWTDEVDQVGAPLARGTVGQFAVLGIDGKRAGVFSVVGVADVGAQDIAVGSYAGASPCAVAQGTGKAVDDPACVKAVAGCGLAVATIEPGQDAFADTPAATPRAGAACVVGDALAVDVDGDGAIETYPVSQLLDAMRAPAEEVSASPVAAPKCSARFAQLGIRLTPGVEPGRAEARHIVDLDILGVIDVDGDGRREVFLAFRYPEGQGRTIAVYSAKSRPGRLELVGEATPWQR